MAEYIEREALLNKLCGENCNRTFEPERAVCANCYLGHVLSDAPAADVAPVVRCAECRSYNKPRTGFCAIHLDWEHPDDFCSYGKRKDGADHV